MGTFTASLRAIGDVKSLPATIELADGRISIVAGTTHIGSWDLTEVALEPIPTGYRMAAEGEQILIELKDLDSFNEALQARKRKKFRRPELQVSVRRPEPTPPLQPATPAPTSAPTRVETAASPRGGVVLPPRPETSPKAHGLTGKSLAFVDSTLARANKKLGPYLPEWMFTRVMFGVAFIAVILMIVLPVWVSTFLLIAGALIIVVGAIVYSDAMLASRWLPGRTTPTHVLLFGVAILMLGVLLGVVAG